MTEVDLRQENMEQARRAHDTLDKFQWLNRDAGSKVVAFSSRQGRL